MLRVYQIKWICNNPILLQCVLPTSIQLDDKMFEDMDAIEIKKTIHDFLVETYEYEPFKFKYRILRSKINRKNKKQYENMDNSCNV